MSDDRISCCNCLRWCDETPLGKAVPIYCDDCPMVHYVCVGCSHKAGDPTQPGVMMVRAHINEHRPFMVVRLHPGQESKGLDLGHVKTQDEAHEKIRLDAKELAETIQGPLPTYAIMNKLNQEWFKINVKQR